MHRKVVFLGFDAGNKYLIQNWANAGIMPNFRALLAKGLRGNTLSLPGVFVGATWPSFMTGCTPAKHGVHSWEQLNPGTYDFYRCHTGEQLKCEPFWNGLSRAGRRVAILDIPLSGLSKNLNGMQLVEYGFHDAQYGFMTWPPSLAQELIARFGPYPVEGTCNADRDTREYVQFRDDLVNGIKIKSKITRHFLRSENWDFFAQVFTESHCVGHQCWHIHDPNHPKHDPDQARIVGDPLRDVYCAIDAAIGEVLTDVDSETTVVVLASHGMGYKYGPQFLLDQILVRLNVAAPATNDSPEPSPKLRDRFDPFLTWGWQHVPTSLRELLQPMRHGLRDWIIEARDHAPAPTIDSAGGKCFLIQNNYAHGGIRVNLIGREPNGKVAPGAEYESFCAELTGNLMDIVNLDTGKRVVARVLKTDDLYRGEYRNHLPDLLVEWASDAPITAIRIGSEKIGEISGEYNFCRTGDHFPGGMFVAYGPGIKPGALDRTVSIMDFAPTFSQLLDVPLTDVDGRPIAEIVEPARAVQPA